MISRGRRNEKFRQPDLQGGRSRNPGMLPASRTPTKEKYLLVFGLLICSKI